MMTTRNWQQVTKNSNKRLRLIRVVLIGILTLLLTLCCLSLSGCTNKEYVYQDMPKPEIDCIQYIETPEDMLYCLNEYAVRY